MGRKTLATVLVGFGMALAATSLSAQAVRVGGQMSFGEDTDFGVGPRVQLALPGVATGLWLAGSFDYFFPDQGLFDTADDIDYWEINANLLYDITLPSATNVAPYFGAGLNVARLTVSDSGGMTPTNREGTQVGLNLVGGLNFPLEGFTPFVEVRLEVEGGEQFVVAGGILFP